MKSFKVYFRDANERLFDAENIVSVLNYIVYELGESADSIVKIEEIM